MDNILSVETQEQLQDAWAKMTLINFLVKLMPHLKVHTVDIRINISQELELK